MKITSKKIEVAPSWLDYYIAKFSWEKDVHIRNEMLNKMLAALEEGKKVQIQCNGEWTEFEVIKS